MCLSDTCWSDIKAPKMLTKLQVMLQMISTLYSQKFGDAKPAREANPILRIQKYAEGSDNMFPLVIKNLASIIAPNVVKDD